MKTTLLYIHGLGSDQYSRKFLNLKAYFKDRFEYDFIQWDNHSDIKNLINEKQKSYQNTQQLILIGDSTGANFAYQLRELRDKDKDILILTSPLLDLKDRIADFEFPKELARYLIPISNPSNALIIATKTDEILDQKKWFSPETLEQLDQIQVIQVVDNHRLENFQKDALIPIDQYITLHIQQ